jgi:hypothetical protein
LDIFFVVPCPYYGAMIDRFHLQAKSKGQS